MQKKLSKITRIFDFILFCFSPSLWLKRNLQKGKIMLEGKSKICKHPKARTLYVAISAKIASDSQFPFKAGDLVEIRYYPKKQRLEIKQIKKGAEKIE